jgi:hypothetical protein
MPPQKAHAAGRKEHIVFTANFALFAMIFRVKWDVMKHIFLLITTLKAAASRLPRHKMRYFPLISCHDFVQRRSNSNRLGGSYEALRFLTDSG